MGCRRLIGAAMGVWLCVAVEALAQAPIVITAEDTIAWACPANVTTVAACQALEYRARVDKATEFVTLTQVACVTAIASDAPAVATCSTKVPAVLLPAMNAYGSHELTLTAYDPAAKVEGAASLPFAWRASLAAPTKVRHTPGGK